jgi:hypothetical protein
MYWYPPYVEILFFPVKLISINFFPSYVGE